MELCRVNACGCPATFRQDPCVPTVIGLVPPRVGFSLTCNQSPLPCCKYGKPSYNPKEEPLYQVVAGEFLNKCACTRRNGLQDWCKMSRCSIDRSKCLTVPYPSCPPSGGACLQRMVTADLRPPAWRSPSCPQVTKTNQPCSSRSLNHIQHPGRQRCKRNVCSEAPAQVRATASDTNKWVPSSIPLRGYCSKSQQFAGGDAAQFITSCPQQRYSPPIATGTELKRCPQRIQRKVYLPMLNESCVQPRPAIKVANYKSYLVHKPCIHEYPCL